jgi:hypothetical protein
MANGFVVAALGREKRNYADWWNIGRRCRKDIPDFNNGAEMSALGAFTKPWKS